MWNVASFYLYTLSQKRKRRVFVLTPWQLCAPPIWFPLDVFLRNYLQYIDRQLQNSVEEEIYEVRFVEAFTRKDIALVH